MVSSLGVLFYSSATPHRVCVSLDPHSQEPFMEAAERARDRGEGRCVPAHWLWRAHPSSFPQKGQQRKCISHMAFLTASVQLLPGTYRASASCSLRIPYNPFLSWLITSSSMNVYQQRSSGCKIKTNSAHLISHV